MRLSPDSDFAQYEMTIQEMEIALQLSPETKAYIQNLKAQAASDLINNIINPAVGSQWDAMRQAEVRGEIKAYAMILAGELPPQTSNENQQ